MEVNDNKVTLVKEVNGKNLFLNTYLNLFCKKHELLPVYYIDESDTYYGEIVDDRTKIIELNNFYNIPQSSDRQIHVFDMDNESFYFVGNDLNKTLKHMQTQLVKMYFSENSNTLSDIFFKLMTCNVVRNGLNAKTTLLEKFSKIPMIN